MLSNLPARERYRRLGTQTQEVEAMFHGGHGFRRRDQSFKKSHHPDGRRLMPAELAEVAAAMGLPVSSKRYEVETAEDRNRRAVAYERAAAIEAKARPTALPKHLRGKRPPKKHK
jgi:hypothetical protein